MDNTKLQEIFERIFDRDDFTETSRLSEPEFFDNEVGNLCVKLYGGMNGWGESKDYLYDLYEIIEALESNDVHAYLVEFAIDALDDVFRVVLELRDLNEVYKGKPE